MYHKLDKKIYYEYLIYYSTSNEVAKPKSAITKVSTLFYSANNKLSGFKSLWIIYIKLIITLFKCNN